jgi:hypothetical protein
MTAEALRYPPGDQAHRPHPHNWLKPADVFRLNGRGWWSPELSDLLNLVGEDGVRRACEATGLDARRQSVPALRAWLEGQR